MSDLGPRRCYGESHEVENREQPAQERRTAQKELRPEGAALDLSEVRQAGTEVRQKNVESNSPQLSDFNEVWDNRPPSPTRDLDVEVDVVARRCVYVNNHRIAGGKPYVSEKLPSHTLKTKLGNVLDAFSEKQIRAALREKKAVRDYFAAYHAAKRAASCDTRPEGGDSTEIEAPFTGGAVPHEDAADAQSPPQ